MAKRASKQLWVVRISDKTCVFIPSASRPNVTDYEEVNRAGYGLPQDCESGDVLDVCIKFFESFTGLKLKVGECKSLNSRTLRALRWAKE